MVMGEQRLLPLVSSPWLVWWTVVSALQQIKVTCTGLKPSKRRLQWWFLGIHRSQAIIYLPVSEWWPLFKWLEKVRKKAGIYSGSIWDSHYSHSTWVCMRSLTDWCHRENSKMLPSVAYALMYCLYVCVCRYLCNLWSVCVSEREEVLIHHARWTR